MNINRHGAAALSNGRVSVAFAWVSAFVSSVSRAGQATMQDRTRLALEPCGMNVGNIFHQQRRLWVRLHEKQLNGYAWAMVRRRTKAAGITTQVCNHTFR